MPTQTRRTFLQTAAASLTGAALLRGTRASAAPLGLPLGLQLYSVREQLAKDYEGTLKQVAGLGFKEVESAGYYNKTTQQVNAAMHAAGLNLVSAHYSYDDLNPKLPDILDFNKQLGVRYIICAFPGFKNPTSVQGKSFAERVRSFTLDDYRWNAEQFNRIGGQVKQAGMQFGYHNHTMEFQPQQGVVPFDELIRLTDPALVTFEMDAGWVKVGGGDPAAYLRRYPTRISMMHIKDFKRTTKPESVSAPPPSAELGQGTVNFPALFAAASRSNIKHLFVEQEEYDMPWLDALRIDANYMQHLKA
jgi:sugar phosphate isomerase/epimerase